MDNTELITIIVPVYNIASYLRRCIDSILAQTYTCLEIILVDDGSTDHCGAICDEYALKDSRIKVIHQHNQGLSAARNAGIAVAKGAYIGFVDSDDCISPDMYCSLYGLITVHKADMAVCGFYYKRENGVFKYSGAGNKIKLYTFQEIPKAHLMGVISVNVWCKLYKREVVNEKIFPVGQCYEDLYAMPAILLQCKKVVVTDTPYYYYTCRGNSICNTYTVELVRQHFNSAVFRNSEIQKWSPELRPFAVRSQIEYDMLLYYILFGKMEASPESDDLMHIIRTDLRQYRVSELLNAPRRYLPAALILRYIPACYPGYSFVESILRNLLWEGVVMKLRLRRVKQEECPGTKE